MKCRHILCFTAALLVGCSQQHEHTVAYQLTLIDTRTTETIKESNLFLPTRLDQNYRGPCRWGQSTTEQNCRVSLQNGKFNLSYVPAQAPQKRFVLEGVIENGKTAHGRVQLFDGQSVQVVAFFKLTYQND